MNGLMALTMALGIAAANVSTAEAGHRHGVGIGIAAGIIGLGVGAAIANAHPRRHYYPVRECYPGPEECGWANRHCFVNRWGDRVCRGGRWTCWRDEICD